jgi:hypothetical protein
MQEPTHIRKALVLGGLVFSFVGLFWLLSLSYHPPEYLLRFGFISAVMAVMGAFIVSWAVAVAYLARRWNWSPRTCGLAGLVFVVPAAYFFLVSDSPHVMSVCGLLLGSSSLTGNLCRHLAYPQLSDDEFVSQPPPSLLPK